MLIYGSKMLGVKNVVHGVGACPNCGVYGKYRSYDGRKWGHLYFIPLIPLGGPARVMHECAGCNMGTHVPTENVLGLYEHTEQLMALCIESAAGGLRTFLDPEDGEAIDNDGYLLHSVEMLYKLGYDNELSGLIALLDTEPSRYEHGIALGTYREAQGNAPEAEAAYQSAANAAPDRLLGHALLGDLAFNTGDPERSLAHYDRVLDIDPSQLAVLVSKVNAYEALKRYAELSETIDRVYALEPELMKDKRLKKLKKKCEKKTR